MKSSLILGLSLETTYTVTAEMTPPSIPAAVLATPRMIALIEHACVTCIKPHLDDSQISLGTHVNISHVGPARVGEEVTVSCILTEIERRRLVFTIEVRAPAGIISTGTHQRAVVHTSMFKRKRVPRKDSQAAKS